MKIVLLDGYTYRLVNGDFFQLFNTKSFKNFNLLQHDLFDISLFGLLHNFVDVVATVTGS